jgi:hypothetical protein
MRLSGRISRIRRGTRTGLAAVVVAALALAAGSATIASARLGPVRTVPAGAPGRAASTIGVIPADAVAVIAGKPLAQRTFAHWLRIAAVGQAAGSPGTPVIIPDPPTYRHCIATARKLRQFAHTPPDELKADCVLVFKQLRDPVMDLLLRADWYSAYAAELHITITHTEVLRAYRRAKAQQFHSEKAFRAFLRHTGQRVSDVLFRVRVNQTYEALIRVIGHASAVDANARQMFRAGTICAPLYQMNDCAPPAGS